MLPSQKVDTVQSTDYGPKSDPVNGSFAVQHVEQVLSVMWPVRAFSTLAQEASVCSDAPLAEWEH